jgi:hypothetical protein
MRHGTANWEREARGMANTDVLIADGNAEHLLHCRSKIVRVAEQGVNSVTGLVARTVHHITKDE